VLALRLYEQSCGSLPERLDALVPQWIEAVPTDPYDGQPFRYARDRRLVYSVGSSRHDMEGRGGNVLFSVSQNPDVANVQTGAVHDH